ncbi:methyl-accepting chemotaxis protein [Desulfovibrio sp. JC022]|uniref:methyl-accepting chemotaxis protein n=1 Tax=Desulfovibrio sp. JC022 TaxID=2593642 RepID=UPI0013D2ADC8|nr:methyl-accepting chemotaxis protein [Desulfovibrio sp. JC022]NDV24952.1 methyl-accepting chemotaxis protein [Desulfovibrio sp. JC022]
MNLLNKINVSMRIGLLATILLLMMIISAIMGLKLTHNADLGLKTVYLDRVVPLKQLKIISDEYAINIVDTSHKVRSTVLSWNQGIENLITAQKRIKSELNTYLNTELVPDEIRLTKELKPLLKRADVSLDQLRSIFQSQDKQQLINYIQKDLYQAIDPVTEVIAKLIDIQLVVAEGIYQQAGTDYSVGLKSMIGIVVGALVLSILTTYLIGRSLTTQLGGEPRAIQNIATKIAAGDLHAAREINRDKAQGVSRAMLGINDSLTEISTELEKTVTKIKLGDLRFRAETSNLSGFFANIMANANMLADSLVNYLDDIGNPIFCIDKNQDMMFANKAAKSAEFTPSPESRKKCIKELYKNPQGSHYEQILTAQGLTSVTTLKPDTTVSYTGIPISDDNGALTGVFEIIVDQTKVIGMQSKVSRLAEQASAISERLSNSANALNEQVDEASKGATIQSERTAETATAMEEMNATVIEVARNAGQAAENTGLTKEKATSEEAVVSEVVEAIEGIQKQTESLRTDTIEMGNQAEGISSVIDVISDIADQTNLLALNAAIEAARAGEAGRGFAVVADEVRKLAEKTMTATTEVNDAINAIQSSSHRNISSTETTVAAVSKSTELAGQAGSVLKEIVEYSDNSSKQVHSIAAASEQQSATAEEITRSSEEVDKISQTTSASMHEAAKSVEEIAEMTKELDKLIQAMVS